jgi:hypothetical protein
MDKTQLFTRRLPEADVELPGVGAVRVRGLSRTEVTEIMTMADPGREIRFLSTAFVDPVLTEEDVTEWMNAASFSEIELVSAEISRLSGLSEESPKETYKSVPDES